MKTSMISKIRKILPIPFFLFVSSETFAEEHQYHLIEADKLEIKYTRLKPENRDPYAPEYTGRWKDRASLLWKVSVLGRLYWDNDVHAESVDTGAVKTIGWHYFVGIKTFDFLDLIWEHHSRHILDENPQVNSFQSPSQFPVEDGYGILIKIIEEKK